MKFVTKITILGGGSIVPGTVNSNQPRIKTQTELLRQNKVFIYSMDFIQDYSKEHDQLFRGSIDITRDD